MNIEIALKEMPLIAVMRGLEPEQVPEVGQILVGAGFRLIEVTMNSPHPIRSIEALSKAVNGAACIGAGTVTEPQMVAQIKSAGGQFIISPNTDESVIKETKKHGLFSLPGVFTPSEAFAALKYGADALKLFPAEAIPPQAVKAFRAVLPTQTGIFIVGGIDAANMKDYMAAGASGFGIGSSLVSPAHSLEHIRAQAEKQISEYKTARERLSNV